MSINSSLIMRTITTERWTGRFQKGCRWHLKHSGLRARQKKPGRLCVLRRTSSWEFSRYGKGQVVGDFEQRFALSHTPTSVCFPQQERIIDGGQGSPAKRARRRRFFRRLSKGDAR